MAKSKRAFLAKLSCPFSRAEDVCTCSYVPYVGYGTILMVRPPRFAFGPRQTELRKTDRHALHHTERLPEAQVRAAGRSVDSVTSLVSPADQAFVKQCWAEESCCKGNRRIAFWNASCTSHTRRVPRETARYTPSFNPPSRPQPLPAPSSATGHRRSPTCPSTFPATYPSLRP